jgi:hypothetical protein
MIVGQKPLATPLSDRKRLFYEMLLFDTPRLYLSASSYAVQPLRLHPILLISILLYCYEQLSGWI